MDRKFKVGDLIEYSYSKINTLYKHYIGVIYEIKKFEDNILAYYIYPKYAENAWAGYFVTKSYIYENAKVVSSK